MTLEFIIAACRRGAACVVGFALAVIVAGHLPFDGAAFGAEADDPLVGMVVTLLSDADKDVRALGLDQVRTAAPGEAATRQFAAHLGTMPAEAQAGLLAALADRGDRVARTAVLDLLAKSEGNVRIAAIAALGALGDATETSLLCGYLANGEAAERAAARASLVRLAGDGVVAAIAAEMSSQPPPVHSALIEILAERRALEVIPALLADALRPEAEVRRAAMAALGQLGGPEHLPGMVAGVLKATPGKEREAAERSVVAVCMRGENDQRAEPLLAAIAALNAADRLALLSTLGRVGGDKARQVIEDAIAGGDENEHALGMQALCNWPDASVATRLIELATTDEHPPHRATALRALIRVAPLPDGRTDVEKLALLKQVMAMCSRDAERHLVFQRASAVRIPETLAFVLPYLDQPAYAQQACGTIVELAHHRTLREANKAAFESALNRVISISSDPVVVERAQRYQKGQTWVRPKPQ